MFKELFSKDKVTFSEFVRFALYSENGYYKKSSIIGRKGDFYTSPSESALFGKTLGYFISRISEEKFESNNISAIELGSNNGDLSKYILDFLFKHHKDLYNKLEIFIVETNTSHKTIILENLKEHNEKVFITDSIKKIQNENSDCIVFCNEFFDALPFDRCVFRKKELFQVNLFSDSGEIIENLDKADQPLIDIIDYLKLEMKEDYFFEIPSYEYREIFKDISDMWEQVLFLIIDYGDKSNFLNLSADPFGTARCFYKHNVSRDFYTNVLSQDITHDVHFTLLASISKDFQFSEIDFKSQSRFLLENNILDIYKDDKDIANISFANDLKKLISPNFMGERFKLILFEKG